MPGRKYTAGSLYRYGFNGKENDNDVKGEGNLQDYGMRIYDTRLGRFLSEDPITNEYPWLTPYQFAANSPIWAIDIDGLEPDKDTDPANSSKNNASDADRLSMLYPSKHPIEIGLRRLLGFKDDKPIELMQTAVKAQLQRVLVNKSLQELNNSMLRNGEIDFAGYSKLNLKYQSEIDDASSKAAVAISTVYKWAQADQKYINTYNSLVAIRNKAIEEFATIASAAIPVETLVIPLIKYIPTGFKVTNFGLFKLGVNYSVGSGLSGKTVFHYESRNMILRLDYHNLAASKNPIIRKFLHYHYSDLRLPKGTAGNSPSRHLQLGTGINITSSEQLKLGKVFKVWF